MGKVIFYHFFPPNYLSGGVKTIYYHAALLNEIGIEAYIYTPHGGVDWLFDKRFLQWERQEITFEKEDILVFPEILQPAIVDALKCDYPCRKIIFCQGAYLFLGFYEFTRRLAEWGVKDILINSHYGKALLENILGADCPSQKIISPAVDKAEFYPEEKEKIILIYGKKWRDYYPYDDLIERMFHVKYPQYRSILWVKLENLTPEEVARKMRKAVICVCLARLEGLGITALEAMASETLIVGFHGGGGCDYAHEGNGFWYSPENLEEMVEGIARGLEGIQAQDPYIMSKIKKAAEKAAEYSVENVKKQLFESYHTLLLQQS